MSAGPYYSPGQQFDVIAVAEHPVLFLPGQLGHDTKVFQHPNCRRGGREARIKASAYSFDGAAVGPAFGCESEWSESPTMRPVQNWTEHGTTVSIDSAPAGTKDGATRKPSAGAGFEAFGSVVPYFEVGTPLCTEKIYAPCVGRFSWLAKLFTSFFSYYLIQRNQRNQKKGNPLIARVSTWFRGVVPVRCDGTAGGAPKPRRQNVAASCHLKIFFSKREHG